MEAFYAVLFCSLHGASETNPREPLASVEETTVELLLDFLQERTFTRQTCEKWQSYLLDVAKTLHGEERRQLLTALLRLSTASWSNFVGDNGEKLFALLFPENQEQIPAAEKDLMRALDARCHRIPSHATVAHISTMVKIIEDRYGEQEQACESFVSACKELMNGVERRRLAGEEKLLFYQKWAQYFKNHPAGIPEEYIKYIRDAENTLQISEKILQNLAEMVQWVAGNFPPLSAGEMVHLEQLCQTTNAYTRTCTDALRMGMEYLESTWQLLQNANASDGERLRIIGKIWLRDQINNLMIHLQKNPKIKISKEQLEVARVIFQIIFRTEILSFEGVDYHTWGLMRLDDYNSAIQKIGFPNPGNFPSETETGMVDYSRLQTFCHTHYPIPAKYWSSANASTMNTKECGQLDMQIEPIMLGLLYWCQRNPLEEVLQTNEGWAMAFVPIANISLSDYTIPLAVGEKTESLSECFIALLNELNSQTENATPPSDDDRNPKMKNRLRQLLKDPNGINCQQAVEFLHWLYTTVELGVPPVGKTAIGETAPEETAVAMTTVDDAAADKRVIPPPIDEEEKDGTQLKISIDISEEGMMRFDALATICLGTSFEATARKMYLATPKIVEECRQFMRECHFA